MSRRWQVLVVVGLLGAGCADNGESSTPSSPALATAPPTATDPSVPPGTTASSSSAPIAPTTTEPAPRLPVVPDASDLQALLDKWAGEVHTLGASMAVSDAAGGQVAVASGVDDRALGTPMTIDRQFHIASITKSFVTASVLHLVEEGRLSLDDTVGQWVPELPAGDGITVAMLLGHTSGLADITRDRPEQLQQLALADLTRAFTPAEALALSSGLPPDGEPGARFDYANNNFLVLGMVLTAVTGTPFEQLMDEQWLGPLGLDGTTAAVPDAFGPREAHGWFTLDPAVGDASDGTFDPSVPRDLDIAGFPRSAVLTIYGSSAQMRSTLADLLTWGRALYGGDVLGEGTALLWSGGPTDRATTGYGLGTTVTCACPVGTEPVLVGHDGQFIGARSLVVYSPATGLTVALHANTAEISGADLERLALAAIDLAG